MEEGLKSGRSGGAICGSRTSSWRPSVHQVQVELGAVLQCGCVGGDGSNISDSGMGECEAVSMLLWELLSL